MQAAFRDRDPIPHLNDLLESVDGPTLAPKLLRTLRRLAPFDRGVVRVVTSDGAHRTVFDTALAGTSHWLDESDLPNASGVTAVCGVATLGSRDFTTLDLRGQSVPWAGENEPQFAYLVRVSHDTALCLLVSCKRHELPLDGEAIARLERAAPAVRGALRANWRLWGAATVPIAVKPDDFAPSIQMAFDAFAANQLTPREHDVVRCLLRGESTRNAAAALGIAEATVALHRKRAYAKLGVSSQGQLFARFLRTVGR